MDTCATITSVRPMVGYRLHLTFADGTNGTVDLAGDIVGRGGDFASLEDPAYFRRVKVNPELGTIQWPNEVDYCPDLLYDMMMDRKPSPHRERVAVGRADKHLQPRQRRR